MGIDEIYKEVTESARDIKHIRGDLADVKRDLKEETKACNKRISAIGDANNKRLAAIEAVQNLNVGKLSVILIGIGAVILGGVQVLLWLLGKFIK